MCVKRSYCEILICQVHPAYTQEIPHQWYRLPLVHVRVLEAMYKGQCVFPNYQGTGMAEGDFTSFPKLPLHLILQAPIFYIRKKKKNLDGFVFGSKNMYQMK